jgi:hypothetical protein
MQGATTAAIADGRLLLEVDFPTAGLDSVAGDAEGQNEMTYSLEYLRRFLVLFQLSGTAATTRVFFPDKKVCRASSTELPSLNVINSHANSSAFITLRTAFIERALAWCWRQAHREF